MVQKALKLGRLPGYVPNALQDLTVYASGVLPAPPASWPVPAVPYPMDGNDIYGDCVSAGGAHLVAAWDKQFGQTDHVPTSQNVIATYFGLTGGVDSGLVEADFLRHWKTYELFRQTIAGYAPVNVQNFVTQHQAIAYYGGIMYGIQCPQSAQDQAQAGEPWTYVPGSPIVGGHCIVGLGYTLNGILCASWGQVFEVYYNFLIHYLDEAWCILPHQLVEAKKDTLGIDIASLTADLQRV